MTESIQTQGGQDARVNFAALVDVLIRNHEIVMENLAKESFQNKGGGQENPSLFCGLLYFDGSGGVCPLGYYHSVVESEVEPVD